MGTNSVSHADTAWMTRVYEHGGGRSGIQGGCQNGVYNIATPSCVCRERNYKSLRIGGPGLAFVLHRLERRLFRGQANVQATDVHRKEKSTAQASGGPCRGVPLRNYDNTQGTSLDRSLGDRMANIPSYFEWSQENGAGIIFGEALRRSPKLRKKRARIMLFIYLRVAPRTESSKIHTRRTPNAEPPSAGPRIHRRLPSLHCNNPPTERTASALLRCGGGGAIRLSISTETLTGIEDNEWRDARMRNKGSSTADNVATLAQPVARVTAKLPQATPA
ncbi:hypothetical protein B0H17DRAFT_1140459 [Mycena rosella]|uniref:Uncharacterized protein n=1 Tax=Mycena rosella TaxID=1033263 RepID=A0AAD7D1X4_MYCRO|nr:hypothetical protein B0H17DRAFT_1140459 [Mycena rosella]